MRRKIQLRTDLTGYSSQTWKRGAGEEGNMPFRISFYLSPFCYFFFYIIYHVLRLKYVRILCAEIMEIHD